MQVGVQGLTWQPLGRSRPALFDVTLELAPGERVLLAGPSGSGKSTLLRGLAGLLREHGNGRYAGSLALSAGGAGDARGVGLLLQDPADAVVARRVGRDVAFGPENLAVPRDEIWARVGAALRATRFPFTAEHLVDQLSGGERQRLALAGVMVLRPGLLLLDEPTAMLDPPTAAAVRSAVMAAAVDVGATTVVVEHHLAPWVGFAHRVVVLGPEGVVRADGPPSSVLAVGGTGLGAELAAAGVWVPGAPDPVPLPVPAEVVGPHEPVDARLAAERAGVCRGGHRSRRWVLRDVDAEVRASSVLAVTGPSGAGKSTLLSLLAGLDRPAEGRVEANGALRRGLDRPAYRWSSTDLARRVGWVPQQAEHSVVGSTVAEDLRVTTRRLGYDRAAVETRVSALAEVLGLSGLLSANPYTLSGGEQRRLSLAVAVAHGPDVLVLDEPTLGQDRLTWAAVTGVVVAARAGGAAVALATHDRLAVHAVADRRLVLAEGRPAPREEGPTAGEKSTPGGDGPTAERDIGALRCGRSRWAG